MIRLAIVTLCLCIIAAAGASRAVWHTVSLEELP